MAAEEWRHCAEWLVRCQILPADHKATRPDATAFDLAQALRDGVVLCHLLNSLKPNCIDMKDFSSRPQMSQVCFRNYFLPCQPDGRLDLDLDLDLDQDLEPDYIDLEPDSRPSLPYRG